MNIHRVGIIGAGTMGAGIAQWAAMHGAAVQLVDASADALQRGVAGIHRQIQRLVEKGKISASAAEAACATIVPVQTVDGLTDCQLVIEAVIEDLKIKQQVFQNVERAVGADAVLATNTSALSVGEIASGLKRPQRLIGMHFFNPAPLMPLVEIIAHAGSDAGAIKVAQELVRAWGKTPVVAKDTPGFIVNRVARGFYLESLRLLGEGFANVDEIDRTLRELAGFRMGPFELMDVIGLDVNLAVSRAVWERFGRHSRFRPHRIQEELVRQGKLGRKSGAGFYDYATEPPRVSAGVAEVKSGPTTVAPQGESMKPIREFASRAVAATPNDSRTLIIARVLGAIINEGGLALEEGTASAGDIDLAMELGTNYPKGPLAWAGTIGHEVVGLALAQLNSLVTDGRFAPARMFLGR